MSAAVLRFMRSAFGAVEGTSNTARPEIVW